MTAVTAPKISKWPFFLADALLIALAWFIHSRSAHPTGGIEVFAYVACVAIGAWISITPFLKDYQAELKFAETEKLISTASQLENLEKLSGQISDATGQWLSIRDAADKTAAAAKGIADGMAAEVKAFNQFIEKTNDGEKATLRLEIDKLRRGEVESLQVIVRMLDHIFALHQAAQRARQPGVTEQINRFQAACVDAARRIGLVPFSAAPLELFDGQKHQVLDSNAPVPEGSKIASTVAAGYTFQGRMIRPAVVQLESAANPAMEDTATPDAGAVEPAAPVEAAERGQSNLL
ncbi:MAG TPA: nucleotide exchange factor GrpE [Verrucomicrobiae bacterium]|nr:nucleotide exchange factor GrpE [Verrucomicrobiae bacterium]